MEVTPRTAAAALEIAIKAQRPAMLWGDPGIGKSQVVQQTAAGMGLDLIDLRLSLLDPVDLRGLPSLNGDHTVWNTPAFLPRSGRGVLFLDEMNRAPMSVLNAGLQLVLDRKLGEYQLPDGWTVVAAGNREKDGGVTRLSPAMSNRLVHLDVVPDFLDWRQWALGAGIPVEEIAFLTLRQELLHKYSREDHAWPSPRSWEFVGEITKQAPDPDVELALYEGTVGHGPAIEYLSFLKMYRTIPNMDLILMNPQQAPVPPADQVSTIYALSAALSYRADCANIGRVTQYLDRLPEDFAVFAIRAAATRDPGLCSTPEFISWTVKHQNAL